MANMSYCRFENTYNDLVDCHEALINSDLDDLSPSEKRYATYLIELCKRISEDFSEIEDDEEE